MASAPSVASAPAGVHPLERRENFPVALRVLPAAVRGRLHAVYSLARRIDDAGDDPHRSAEQRLADLDAIDAEVRARFAGTPMQQPFLDLLEANRLDQVVRRYPTYADLLGYCRRSAEPVGRLVLTVFEVDDTETARLSDLVCTALQILEHCQDVAEDRRDRDRIYMPAEDLARFGVAAGDLDATKSTDAVRRLLAFEVERARALLDEGAPIVRRLRGWARLAVAGYVAGGRATTDALRRADYDVLAHQVRPRTRDIARHAIALLCGRG